jgi:hypothetical protein
MEPTVETGAPDTVPVVIEEDRRLSHGTRSRPLLGLPLARLIPQDVHSAFDYVGAIALAAISLRAKSPRARVAGMSLGVGALGVSLTTDYRLSAVKLIPIEVHEVLDYAVGLATVAAPFVLGYRKREPLVSALQIGGGVATMLISLFTDYRAYRRRRIGFRGARASS